LFSLSTLVVINYPPQNGVLYDSYLRQWQMPNPKIVVLKPHLLQIAAFFIFSPFI
jgi:hypothetical protein